MLGGEVCRRNCWARKRRCLGRGANRMRVWLDTEVAGLGYASEGHRRHTVGLSGGNLAQEKRGSVGRATRGGGSCIDTTNEWGPCLKPSLAVSARLDLRSIAFHDPSDGRRTVRAIKPTRSVCIYIRECLFISCMKIS